MKKKLFDPFLPLKRTTRQNPLGYSVGPSAQSNYRSAAPSVSGAYAAPGTAELDRQSVAAVLAHVESSVREAAGQTSQDRKTKLIARQILKQIDWVRIYLEKTADPTGYLLAMNLAAMVFEARENLDAFSARQAKAGAAARRNPARDAAVRLKRENPQLTAAQIARRIAKQGHTNKAERAAYHERTVKRWLAR